MQEVIPNLFIGDYAASQDVAALEAEGIKAVVSAMRQPYDSSLSLHRIPVDDTSNTNIICHFQAANDFIRAARARGEGVLVHCQAGVSRSTTIVCAYLMKEVGLNAEQAVEMVRAVRPEVDPTHAFLHQLEMYERCEFEWDPVKWSEQRRFLMNFAQKEIMNGTAPSLVLAYYPSPAASPAASSPSDPYAGLKMTPVEGGEARSASQSRRQGSSDATTDVTPLDNGDETGLGAPSPSMPVRKRLTTRGVEAQAKSPEKKEVEKIGTKEQVVVVGKRIRCKMCRRELAGRDHILFHEPGIGQQAFAPNRRDMATHRAELERRRLDEMDREKREGRTAPFGEPLATTSISNTPSPPTSLPSGLAALRISKPAHLIPGLRVAVPRPAPGLRAAVARPTPKVASVTAPTFDDPSPIPILSATPTDVSTPTEELTPSAPAPSTAASLAGLAASEPALLPSHLCSAYFVEPLSWMSPILESGILAGKIVCPNTKCGAKLGSYDWAGQQCSCGAWVCPGFALNVAKTDEFVGA